ncbi:MAG: RNA polymerase subunit sigma-70 [Planctomycetaceae bacterium]|nr:RNA polymerase subunit sigma-70 [Planctomycetaceae bacterium]
MGHDSASSARSTVSDWLESLKRGSDDASLKIWQRYVEQLVREADRRLKNLPRRAVDGEDIAQEAFAGFFRGVAANQFSKLDDRHDLWQLLITLADRRAIDHMRRELGPERGAGRVRGGSALEPPANRSGSGPAGLDKHAAPPVTPESADALIRLIQRSFPELADEELQRIVLDRAANYSVAEIAQRHGITLRTTERKLDLIRQILERAAAKER